MTFWSFPNERTLVTVSCTSKSAAEEIVRQLEEHLRENGVIDSPIDLSKVRGGEWGHAAFFNDRTIRVEITTAFLEGALQNVPIGSVRIDTMAPRKQGIKGEEGPEQNPPERTWWFGGNRDGGYLTCEIKLSPEGAFALHALLARLLHGT